MAGPPIEQDYILDADGRQVMSMVDLITAKMAKIQQEVTAIVNTANKGGKDFDKSLDLTVKRMQQALGQMRTVVSSTQTAGPGVQALNANATLARQTREATEYARGLNTARDAAEALTAKIARLNQVAAARGREGGFATVANTDQLKRLEATSAALRKLDAQYETLEAKARRSRGIDLSPQISAVSDARQRLFEAASAPRRTNLTPEMNALSDAQAALAERIALARTNETAAIRAGAAARREIAVQDAAAFKTATELDRARAQSDARIRDLRNQLKVATDQERVGLLATLEVEKARGRQLSANAREVESMARAEAGLGMKTNKALIPSQMRADASIYGATTVSTGAQLERELALKQLSAAVTDQERITALRNVELANARVVAAQKLVVEEEKELRLLNAETEALRRNALANDKSLAGRSAQNEVKTLGLYEAQAAVKTRIEALQARIGVGLEREQRATREQLALEEKKLGLINAEVGAREREIAAQERSALASQKQAAREQRRSFGGRLGTAAFNTALYGGVAALGFGALSGVQEGLTFLVEFEDELAKLSAIAGATEVQMQQLKGSILGVAEGSRFSTIDLTKISQTLAQAGVAAGEMESVLRAVTTLATASGSTPDEAVQLVTSALGSFQLQSSEAARVADLMTSALNRTKLTVQQTGQAIQYVGATAYEQNISLEQLLATVGAVAQAGVKSGSTIGTGMRQFLVDLSDPSKKLLEQLELLKLSAADVDVSVRGLPAVLETLASAGFGAGQAYAGLETRAAAFYLVAKNNVEVMDQLQLAFANSGAAAAANDRAMNSLSAQWQRFKNILSAGFSDSMEAPMAMLKDLLTAISDRISEMDRAAEELSKRQAGGWQGYVDRAGGSQFQAFFAYENENLIPDMIENVAKLQEVTMNLLDGSWWTGASKGWGTRWAEYANSVENAATATRDAATAVAETTEKVDAQRGKISELDKEIQRLNLQKDELRNHDIRSGAETVTLTSRFEGLAVHLVNVGNKYDDLTQAVQRYRLEQLKLLGMDLMGQNAALRNQTQDAQREGVSLIGQIRGNRGLMEKLTPREREALGRPVQGSNAAVLNDAAKRLERPGPGQDLAGARQINELIQRVGIVATNTTQMRINDQSIAVNTASQTEFGQVITRTMSEVNANIQKLQSLTGGDRTQLAEQTLATLANLEKETKRRVPLVTTDGAKALLAGTLQDIPGLRQQVRATTAPTAADTAAASRAERAAERAEREAARGPRATQADIDAVGAVLGLPLGRGRVSAASQDALHRRGVTPATGATSSHSKPGGVARDFPTGDVSQAQGEAYAAAARKYFADQGIPVRVAYENGRGRNGGTGKHVHVQLLPGARRPPKGENDLAQSAFDAQADIDRAGTQLDQRAFTSALREIKSGTSQAVIDQTGLLLLGLSAKLERDAITELAKNGIANPNDPRYKERMAQVAEQQRQLADQYSDAITEGLVKNLELQVKNAIAAFDAAIQPAEAALARAQAAASGLDNYSLENRVPDYVRTLANQRTRAAQEDLQRSTLSALPGRISAQQGLITEAQGKLNGMSPEDSGYARLNAELQELQKTMAALQSQQTSLNASLSAGAQIPTTIADAFRMATEAYRATNVVIDDFNTLAIQNMGGALETVRNGLTEMFTSILTGSQSALGAFASFAKGIINYMVQIAAKAAAAKIFELLLNLGMSAFGPKAPAASAPSTPNLSYGINPNFAFNGGRMGDDGRIHLARGGRVTNGSDTHDSVNAKLAKGEWVVRKKAVDSVGNDFMNNLNRHGAKALAGMGAVPVLPPPAHQETSVYVVAPQEKPSMGPNDVLVTIQSDILSGGETKKLIKHIAQGG